jgi:hypothetical protein
MRSSGRCSRQSVHPSKLPAFDPAEIARIATQRSRRRRLVVAVLGLTGLVASGVTALAVFRPDAPGVSAVSEPSTSARPPAGAWPGCRASVEAKLTSGAIGSRDGWPALATVRAGTQTRTEADVTSTLTSTLVVRALLVVAKSAARDGAGPPDKMPAYAAVRPENQLARSDPMLDLVPSGQRMTVTFQPTTPGIYAVYFIADIAQPEHCLGPTAPPPGTPDTATTTQKMGEIIVD